MRNGACMYKFEQKSLSESSKATTTRSEVWNSLMQILLCVRWDHCGFIFYETLRSASTPPSLARFNPYRLSSFPILVDPSLCPYIRKRWSNSKLVDKVWPKPTKFLSVWVNKLPERWKKVIGCEREYFACFLFLIFTLFKKMKRKIENTLPQLRNTPTSGGARLCTCLGDT